MNSENKNDNRLLLRLPDKRNLKGSVKYVALSNLFYILYIEKYKKFICSDIP